MLALRELQEAFYRAMMDPAAGERPLLAALEEAAPVAQQRLAAYRRVVHGTLGAALLATYPVVARIVGQAFFAEAARCYRLSRPSRSGDLNEYGGDFADFLEGYGHARELPYLGDVARLEWLVQSVYYAADAPPADLSALAAAAPERWGDVRLAFSPACARIDSAHPLDQIWRVNASDYEGDMTVDFAQGARVFVNRRADRVFVEGLAAAPARFIDALRGGESLAAATATAVSEDAGFDPGPLLQRLVRDGIVVGAEFPGVAPMPADHGPA